MKNINDEGEGWGNGLKERGYQVSFPEKEGALERGVAYLIGVGGVIEDLRYSKFI